MFEDSTQPFDPNDNVPKPNEGDILILKDLPEINIYQAKRVKVLDTFDSLAESWDPVGESAWGQHDINNMIGFRGHWYALVCDPDFEDEEWSVASYEVAKIVGK